MSLIHHIERLREKPDHKKKQIAFFTSAGVTFVIFALWLVTLQANLDNENNIARERGTLSPFKAFGENVGNVYEGIVNSKDSFKKAISGETNVQVEVVPAKNVTN